MDKRAVIIAGLGAALLLHSAQAKAATKETASDVIRRHLAALAQYGGEYAQSVDVSGLTAKSRLTDSEALNLIRYLDGQYFNGRFRREGLERMALGIFKQESRLRPAAVNWKDPGGGSHGIGQVQAKIARVDYGVADYRQLYNVMTGARVSMQHMLWTKDYLTRRLGRQARLIETIQAYNAGVGGYMSGTRVPGYLSGVLLRMVA